MRKLTPLELHEFDSQPLRVAGGAQLDADPHAVFVELADPSLWFPLMRRSIWKTGATSGVGAEREINHAVFGRARERMLAWDQDVRVAFTMIEASSPFAEQIGEEWLISREAGITRLDFKFVATPSRAGRLIQPLLKKSLETLFVRGVQNIGKRAASFRGKKGIMSSSLVRPITRMDIKGPAMYAHIRDDYRNRVIEMKQARRVLIGDRVELVFDNRHTLTLQIEETCRLENLTTDAQINEEIAVNNSLMPTEDSLAATLFIPLPQDEHIKANLRALVGLDEHVILHVGPHAIRAAFEPGRSTQDRISAVQYTRYPLAQEAKRALLTPGTPIAVEIDHPNYRHRVQCPEELRASLAADYGA